MFKQNSIKPSIKMSINHDKKSMKLSNLSMSILPTTPTSNRIGCSTEKLKYKFSNISSMALTKNRKLNTASNQSQSSSGLSRNVAIHFGDFHGLYTNAKKLHCNNHYDNLLTERTTKIKKVNRLEFTRQMMYKLERATDVKDYTQQVSTLLQKTIEPPHFKLHQFISDNSMFDTKRRFLNYPSWYKEPYKVPFLLPNSII